MAPPDSLDDTAASTPSPKPAPDTTSASTPDLCVDHGLPSCPAKPEDDATPLFVTPVVA